VENERLKQELKSCRSSELQKLEAAAASCSLCPQRQGSSHRFRCSVLSQLYMHQVYLTLLNRCLLQDAEALRREGSRWENEARQREHRLAELERELLEKSSRVEALHQQLDDSRRQLEESRRRQVEAEQTLCFRLQECEDELARQAAAPPRVKVRIHHTSRCARKMRKSHFCRGWCRSFQTDLDLTSAASVKTLRNELRPLGTS